MENNELERELKKEIEFVFEQDKLKEVVEEIKGQILKYTDKRKAITEGIINLRKKNLEEYKDDEDKIIEYFDHERFVREEAFRIIDKKLKELTILSSSPYFGKFSFEDEFGDETIYIGRFGLTKELEYEPIVIDWRSPVAALFYAGKLGNIKYNGPLGEMTAEVLSKRQFIIKKAELLGMFDTSMDVKDEILQMILSKNAGEKLKDIIMTIQAEQDEIIRQPRNQITVVDGVAGSGKTTIALHRVAYLLYNYRDVLQDKVLILGPNNIFIDYISTVLPSLGEIGVKQYTFRDLAMDILGLEKVMNFKDYMERILSGDREFNKNVAYKGSLEYINELDKIIQELDNEYFKIENIKFYDKVIVNKEEIQKMFDSYFKDMPLFRRSKKIKRIIYSKIKDERDNLVRQINKEHEETISKLSESELKAQYNNIEFIRKNRIREIVQEVIRIKKKLFWLDNPNINEIYNEFNDRKELTYDDLAPIIYLKIRLEGLKYNEEVKHVVIDEAQDYSPLQFRVIKELTACNSFTIVGDSNQRIMPIDGSPAMLELKNILSGSEIYNFILSRSYRSTKEIIEYANKYIEGNKTVPLVRSGEKVVEKHIDSLDNALNKIIQDVARLKKKGYESIAVVCRDLKETEALGKLLKKSIKIKILDREDIIYSSGEVILPSYFAKGLEFDAVILIDTNTSIYDEEYKLKYVMSTRALHELYIYTISSIK
ncbi:HelD family protein [Clostridium thailandense]|uniref:HelD family protein n=1 Tax=Clostridium thailandense TaxID=2794346 RepID=UPI003988DC42